MPSLPSFSYSDSTHKNESNCIYYMVVSNQALDREITLYQLVLKCYFLNFGHLFRCQVPVLSFPCSYLLFLVVFTILFHRIWWRTDLATYIFVWFKLDKVSLSEHLSSTKHLIKIFKNLEKSINILYRLLMNFSHFLNSHETWKPTETIIIV